MKLFLDDERKCPDGWVLVKTVHECISLLKTQPITHLSLDHDLGAPINGTGYEVLCWIEEEVFLSKSFSSLILNIHSANPVGYIKMSKAIDRIKTYQNKNKNEQ